MASAWYCYIRFVKKLTTLKVDIVQSNKARICIPTIPDTEAMRVLDILLSNLKPYISMVVHNNTFLMQCLLRDVMSWAVPVLCSDDMTVVRSITADTCIVSVDHWANYLIVSLGQDNMVRCEASYTGLVTQCMTIYNHCLSTDHVVLLFKSAQALQQLNALCQTMTKGEHDTFTALLTAILALQAKPKVTLDLIYYEGVARTIKTVPTSNMSATTRYRWLCKLTALTTNPTLQTTYYIDALLYIQLFIDSHKRQYPRAPLCALTTANQDRWLECTHAVRYNLESDWPYTPVEWCEKYMAGFNVVAWTPEDAARFYSAFARAVRPLCTMGYLCSPVIRS